MYKKTITYQTYDDEPETLVEDFYFNINEVEAAEMQFDVVGGWEAFVNKLFLDRDIKGLFGLFKGIVLKSVGVRSGDGRRFIKSQKIRDEFEQSAAYEKLMMELFSEDGAIQKFIINVFPIDKSKVAELKKEVEKRNPNIANAIKNTGQTEDVPEETIEEEVD